MFRHLPLNDVHPNAQSASEAAEAAAAQDRFWEMHDVLMRSPDKLSPLDLYRHASELGLDVERFSDDMRRRRYAGRVAHDVQSADASGVSGTPTFFINGRRHQGVYDIDTLTAAVKAAAAAPSSASAPSLSSERLDGPLKRRGRDSNPRTGFNPVTRLAGECLQPLGHLSGQGRQCNGGMSATLDSTPAADGFHMPAEWAPHDGCWMIWPERPDNWRLGGKPAQEAFAAVATAIAGGGDLVTMAVSERQFDHARDVLPPEIRVVEMTTDDAWMRDVGPSFVVDGKGGRRGVDWLFNAWGGVEGGLYWPWDHDALVAQQGPRDRAGGPLPRAAGPRGRVDPRRRRGHGAHDRGVPAEPQPQPVAHARADRGAPVRIPRRGEGPLARRRHRQRRDRRPHRQHRVLHGPGRRRAALDRRRVGPPARDLR